MLNEKLVFSVPELAQTLGVHKNHVYNMISRGELRVVRLGRVVRIPRVELERLGLLARQTPAGPGGE
ncbi:helix-turn-helix domain-containing protein [Meiothermus sp. CFH 77666]|uniref:helix-turn-helix domain-containing protein n=1 Tax=Meiothermus sp. CFH 77666 TaxID=2817942 RepID=UPI001AA0638E|nr:helix-turn-helix domain-containing protein [Meiothermus sp. CFH 77666]MBO1436084.1 helix-turn-helix domain-containing protein [Meiothermus sp. CFH 77666]